MKVKKVRKRRVIITIHCLAMMLDIAMDQMENLVMIIMASQGHEFHQDIAWNQWTSAKVYLHTDLVFLCMLGMTMIVNKLLIVEVMGARGRGLLIIYFS